MMSAWICSTILCLPLARGEFERLPAAALAADLDTLQTNLERLHPGLHRYTSVEELAEEFRRARGALEGGMTVPEFFRVVSEVVACVRCGHTGARLPDSVQQTVLESRKVLPFKVRILQGKVYVTDVLLSAHELAPGTEIRAIDGQPIDAIVARLVALLPGDGHIETGRLRQLEDEFATMYSLFTPGSTGKFSLEIVAPGGSAASTLAIAGASPADLSALAAPRNGPLYSLQIDRPSDVAVLDIRSFGRDAGPIGYEKFLEQSFASLENEEIGSLIIDLRGNGGGADQYGALLISYLTDKPFRYFERIEVTENYSGPGGIVRGADGRRLVTTHPGLLDQQPSEHSFLGRVCMLVDGGTFSTAADVATVAHHLGLVRIVGEETGGGYDGNTSGTSQMVVLANSHIEVRIPLWEYTTANLGHHFSGRGVPPDVVVTPEIRDVLDHTDVGMRRARELLAQK